MEAYTRHKEQEKLKEYQYYIFKRLEQLGERNPAAPLGKIKWRGFYIREWQTFIFNDFFKITTTSSSIDRNKLIKKLGVIPYISRSEKNNGYASFICKQADQYQLDARNVITIGLDTQTVFYQPYFFYTGQNIQILANKNLNQNIALFLIPLIKSQIAKFSWGGNGATLTRLKRSKILLPVTAEGQPDYDFMEDYMHHKEQEKLKEYQAYILKRLKKLEGG